MKSRSTVNREYFTSQIFCAINLHVKSFSDKRPRTTLSLIMHIIFVRLIFGLAMLSENNCDRLRENPAYGINAQVAQCAFLVPRVKNCQNSDFVISMSNNPSTNCYRWLRRLNVSFKGEISRDLQAFRTT